MLKKQENSQAKRELASLLIAAPETEREGLQLLRDTAEAGDAFAQYQLGLRYGQGEATVLDYEQAVFWYRRAAKQNLPEAQYLLCLSYSLGKGVLVDILRAQVWCNAAANNNAEGAAEALAAIEDSMTDQELKTAGKLAEILIPSQQH